MPPLAPSLTGSASGTLADSIDRLHRDDRAIEGLPVRLVIAFVVGVASLSVMLSMVNSVGSLAVSELDVRPTPDVTTPGDQTIDFAVVDADGTPVADATVVVKSHTATIDGVHVVETNHTGIARVALSPALRPNQADGTLQVTIKPPAGTNYVDRRENTQILVVRDSD